VSALLRALRSGPFDNLDGPTYRVLLDDDGFECDGGVDANEEAGQLIQIKSELDILSVAW